MRRSLRPVASSIHATQNRKAPFAVSAIRARPELRDSLAGRVLYLQKPQVAQRTRRATRAVQVSATFLTAHLARPQHDRRRPAECAGIPNPEAYLLIFRRLVSFGRPTSQRSRPFSTAESCWPDA